MITRHEPDEWPPGNAGDLAVFYFDRAGLLVMEAVQSEDEARDKFVKAAGRRDIYTKLLSQGSSAGRISAVVCWARCDGGSEWTVMGETQGYIEERNSWD